MIHGHKTYKDLVKKEKKYKITKEKGKLLMREVKITHTQYYDPNTVI